MPEKHKKAVPEEKVPVAKPKKIEPISVPKKPEPPPAKGTYYLQCQCEQESLSSSLEHYFIYFCPDFVQTCHL